ncbi:hypothetical protein ACU4GI_21595 [Cupriavidus basilensis]
MAAALSCHGSKQAFPAPLTRAAGKGCASVFFNAQSWAGTESNMTEQLLDLFGEQVTERPASVSKVNGTQADLISVDSMSSTDLAKFCTGIATALWGGVRDAIVAYSATKDFRAAKNPDFFSMPYLWKEKVHLFDALCWTFDLFDHRPITPFDAVCNALDLDVRRVRRAFARALHSELRELFRVIRMALGEAKAADVALKLDEYVNLGNWRNQS